MNQAGDGDVLVAVEDPDHVAQLVRTAADLARQRSGRIRVMTVVVKPPDSPFGLFSDETIVEEFAADSHELLEQAPDPEGVELVRDLVVARSVAKGIVSAVEQGNPAALLIGWDSDPTRTDALLGTTVDAVFKRAPTDVYAERIGREADGVDRILVPVAGGPHVRAAAIGAGAIARANDASVTLLSVAGKAVEREAATEFVASARDPLGVGGGDEIAIETHVTTGDAEREIVAAAAEHDVIVLGATRQGVLRGRLVGSVPRRVVQGTDRTVIIARGKGGARGVLGRVSAFLGGRR